MDLTAKPCLDPVGPIDFSENPTRSAQPFQFTFQEIEQQAQDLAVCQDLHRSETQWALNSAPGAGEWKSHDQLSSQGSLRGSPGWEFRRLQWDVSLQTALLRWRILDHPRGQAEMQDSCSPGDQEPFFILGGSTLGSFSAKLSAVFQP